MPEKKCECADPGCPADHNVCMDGLVRESVVLYRIDMEDYTGTEFCNPCAGDAMESGVFSTDEPDLPGRES